MPTSLNDITEKEIEEITKLAALFFTPRQIAIMLEFTIAAFVTECEMEESKFYRAFQSGRLQSELELRTSIIKFAKSGSTPAQSQALKILDESRIKIMDK